jgi:hypothetical protein
MAGAHHASGMPPSGRSQPAKAPPAPDAVAQYEADVIRALGPERAREVLAVVATLPTLDPVTGTEIGVLIGPIELAGTDDVTGG